MPIFQWCFPLVSRWKPQHTFPEDVKDLIKAFEDSGRLQKEPDFSVDDQLLASAH